MRKITAIILLSAFAATMKAQDMKELMKQVPDSVMPILTQNNRLDFMDYLDSDMKAEVSNRFGNKSEMTVITNDYTHIKMTEESEVTIKALPFGSDKVLCMVRTFTSDDVADSEVEFYSSTWKSLPSSTFFTMPTLDAFLVKPDTLSAAEFADIRNKMDMPLIKASLCRDSQDMVLELTATKYMTKEERDAVTPYLKEKITLKWNGNKFE